jgi:hypothetical protein
MGKTACKKKKYSEPKNPKYICEKCGAGAENKEKVCDPRKV